MAKGDYKYLAYSTFYHKDVTSIDDFIEETFSDSRFSKILLDGTFTDIGIGITSYPEDSNASYRLPLDGMRAVGSCLSRASRMSAAR